MATGIKKVLFEFLGLRTKPDPLSGNVCIKNRNRQLLMDYYESGQNLVGTYSHKEMNQERNSIPEIEAKLQKEIQSRWGGALPDPCQLILEYFLYPEIFRSYGSMAPRGILLVGESGNGKSYFFKLLSELFNLPCFCVYVKNFNRGILEIERYSPVSSLDEKYVGSGPRKIRIIFDEASKLARSGSSNFTLSKCVREYFIENPKKRPFNVKECYSLIFLDHLDEFQISNRYSYSVLTQLLTLMQGVNCYENIIVFAAMRSIEGIHPALIRNGRFDIIVQMKKPNSIQRLAILKLNLGRCKSVSFDGEFLEILSCFMSGFSCSDVTAVVNEFEVGLSRQCLRPEMDFDPLKCLVDSYLVIRKKVQTCSKTSANDPPDLTLKTDEEMNDLHDIIKELFV